MPRMGTENLAENVSTALEKADAVLMENHGVLTVGESLVLALERLEVLGICGQNYPYGKIIGKR